MRNVSRMVSVLVPENQQEVEALAKNGKLSYDALMLLSDDLIKAIGARNLTIAGELYDIFTYCVEALEDNGAHYGITSDPERVDEAAYVAHSALMIGAPAEASYNYNTALGELQEWIDTEEERIEEQRIEAQIDRDQERIYE